MFKPVSHQPCGSRAPICHDKFLGFVRQPHGVVNNPARLSYEKKVARLPQRILDMFIFFAICLRFLKDVRQPQDTQGCCNTRKVFVFVLRQPQDYRKVTMRFIARLPQACRETHGCSAGYVRRIVLSCDSLVTFA